MKKGIFVLGGCWISTRDQTRHCILRMLEVLFKATHGLLRPGSASGHIRQEFKCLTIVFQMWIFSGLGKEACNDWDTICFLIVRWLVKECSSLSRKVVKKQNALGQNCCHICMWDDRAWYTLAAVRIIILQTYLLSSLVNHPQTPEWWQWSPLLAALDELFLVIICALCVYLYLQGRQLGAISKHWLFPDCSLFRAQFPSPNPSC